MQEIKIDFGCIKLLAENGDTVERLKKEIREAEILNKARKGGQNE